MKINYFNQEILDTDDIKDKLDLIAKSSTENAKYLSKMLMKVLLYISQKEELHTPYLQEGVPINIGAGEAIIYFSNHPLKEVPEGSFVIMVGTHLAGVKTENAKMIDIKDRRNLKKILKNYQRVYVGFCPEDIDYIDYYYNRLRVYFLNLLKALIQMPYEIIQENTEKACTTLLLSKERFQLPFSKDKTKIQLKWFLKAYQTIMQTVPNHAINPELLFYETVSKEAYYVNMLNEMSLINQIFSQPERTKQVSQIYDITCERMLREAHELGYCFFENNRCIASRYTNGFPNSKENGCCQNTYQDRGKNCRHLKADHSCDICAISCRVFTCGYLQKRGIDHALFQYPLIDLGFGKIKKAEIVYGFFTPKEVMMKKLK